MKTLHLSFLMLIASLAACNNPSSADQPSAQKAEISTTIGESGNPSKNILTVSIPTTTAQNQSAVTQHTVLSQTCGQATMALQCDVKMVNGQQQADCTQTTLSIQTASGQWASLPAPEEMMAYTAVGLGCAQSGKNQHNYFVVQYGELPYGCKFCEWYYLYDSNGKPLTHSKPPVLEDSARPDPSYPNNDEYERLNKELALTVSEPDTVTCERQEHDSDNTTPHCYLKITKP